jgi:hypothetical protein
LADPDNGCAIVRKGDPAKVGESMRAAGNVADRLIKTEPSSRAGMRALLEYVASPEHGVFNPLASTLLR